jgi:hypothetical protein
MLEELRFVEVRIGPSVDTFRGAGGERKARQFDVYGYSFLARRPVRIKLPLDSDHHVELRVAIGIGPWNFDDRMRSRWPALGTPMSFSVWSST